MRFDNYSTQSIVAWELYQRDINLCEQFPGDDWHLMAGDIDNEQEWREFIQDYKDFVEVFIVKDCDGLPFGFVYIFNEKGDWDKISIHGGSWLKEKRSLLNFYAMISLLELLFLNGYTDIETSSKATNKQAIRFLQKVGFTPIREQNGYVYMTVSEYNLYSNTLYKRLHSSERTRISSQG